MAALETSDEQYSVRNGPCTVGIIDKKTGKPLKIVNVNTGFGNPVLETGTQWCLRIDCPGCFTLKVKIGQKYVNIDERIIFSNTYILEGNPGEFSFMFLSLPSELQETLGSDLKVGENNIISIEVQQFTENKPKPLVESDCEDDCSYSGATRGGGGATRGGGGATRGGGGATRGFSSGTNVAGETSVGKIKTQTTKSTFTEKGGKLLFTLEFICQQTDQEKLEANRPYFTTKYANLEKNLESHQSKAEFHTSQIVSISKQMKELEIYKPRTVEQQREEQLSQLMFPTPGKGDDNV